MSVQRGLTVAQAFATTWTGSTTARVHQNMNCTSLMASMDSVSQRWKQEPGSVKSITLDIAVSVSS